MSKRSVPIKAPNPFGEVSDDSRKQPPAVVAPTSPPLVPITKFVVPGQRRETQRARGFVLTERGWTKEEEPWLI